MDFGPHTLHIFVSLIVVLAAAGVALVCDLLKGNNEHLRELAVELKVRHEEAERRINVMEKKGKRIPDLSSVKPLIAAVPATPQARLEPKAEPVQVPLPKVASAASSAGDPLRTSRHERRREMSPAVAAVAQAAAAIVNNREHHLSAASASSNEAGVAEASQAAADGRRKNWDSILKKTVGRQGALIPFESIRESVPAGFYEASVLQRSVESGRTVSGLVVSIGTNGIGADGAAEVAEFLQGQLSGQDFGCQSGIDEYILICSGEQGASAQRRLSAIAEKLWDFQLRSIGGLGVQFSWGSFEARGERIGEAVATAIEQMQDTRQSRRGHVAKAV